LHAQAAQSEFPLGVSATGSRANCAEICRAPAELHSFFASLQQIEAQNRNNNARAKQVLRSWEPLTKFDKNRPN
jgi:hypothetical protein